MAVRSRLTLARLSVEQERRLPAFRDEWSRVVLDTGPCDRSEAEFWLGRAFIRVGLPLPKRMIWTDSPFAALHTYRKIALRGKRDSIGDDDPDRLWVEQVVTGARTYVRREVMRWISLEVWSKAWSQTYLGTGSYLGDRIGGALIKNNLELEMFPHEFS